jgi:hypothetical protein
MPCCARHSRPTSQQGQGILFRRSDHYETLADCSCRNFGDVCIPRLRRRTCEYNQYHRQSPIGDHDQQSSGPGWVHSYGKFCQRREPRAVAGRWPFLENFTHEHRRDCRYHWFDRRSNVFRSRHGVRHCERSPKSAVYGEQRSAEYVSDNYERTRNADLSVIGSKACSAG